MDDEFCRKRARTVRDLAERADPFIKKRLLELAKHYERRISFGSNEKAAVERGARTNMMPRHPFADWNHGRA